MPNFDGFAISWQALEVKFEAATYKLLCSEPNILASSLIYHRVPVPRPDPRLTISQDIAGRRLLVFERAEGETNILTLFLDFSSQSSSSYTRIDFQFQSLS